MRKSLRTQLFLSHLLLVGLLLGVCLIAVAGFLRLGHSINRILEDNYKSVVAAQNMKEALERLDSAASFAIAGQQVRARQQYEQNLPLFAAAYRTEAANITENGEQAVSDDLGRRFTAYRSELHRLIYDSRRPDASQSRALYFDTLQPQFVAVKQRVQDVLDINQAAILRADRRAKREAQIATTASIGITALAVFLGMGLAGRNIAAMMTPLVSLTRQAEEIGAGHLDQRIEVRRNDEIGLLARTFNEMSERLGRARRLGEERLLRAERLTDAALTDLYDPVVVTDATGAVVHLNRAAEGLFGPIQQAQARQVQSVVKEERLAMAITQAAKESRVAAEEGDAALVALGDRTYRLRATPMRDNTGTALGAVAVLEDVTSQREVDRLKTEFIGVASHELRTPVTSLILGVDLLEEGVVGPLTDEQRLLVVALREDLHRLERMMRDLLDLTRLEAGAIPPRFEVTPPRELIDAAWQSVEAQSVAKGIQLVRQIGEDLPSVRADRGQIVRVLINLLSNAIRHTPTGGSVTLGVATEPGIGVRFTVRDTGAGIPIAYIGRIFERFVQVPGATRGGAGLGLSIAQTVVRAHDSEIEVSSERERGSVFTFALPAMADRMNDRG